MSDRGDQVPGRVPDQVPLNPEMPMPMMEYLPPADQRAETARLPETRGLWATAFREFTHKRSAVIGCGLDVLHRPAVHDLGFDFLPHLPQERHGFDQTADISVGLSGPAAGRRRSPAFRRGG